MVTFTQIGLGCSQNSSGFTWARQLFNCPQARGRIINIFVAAPNNPNSASRNTANISLANGSLVFANIIGEGYVPQNFALVLVRGGGFNDTPNVNYSIIRGALECLPVFDNIRRSSHFGTTNGTSIVRNET